MCFPTSWLESSLVESRKKLAFFCMCRYVSQKKPQISKYPWLLLKFWCCTTTTENFAFFCTKAEIDHIFITLEPLINKSYSKNLFLSRNIPCFIQRKRCLMTALKRSKNSWQTSLDEQNISLLETPWSSYWGQSARCQLWLNFQVQIGDSVCASDIVKNFQRPEPSK